MARIDCNVRMPSCGPVDEDVRPDRTGSRPGGTGSASRNDDQFFAEEFVYGPPPYAVNRDEAPNGVTNTPGGGSLRAMGGPAFNERSGLASGKNGPQTNVGSAPLIRVGASTETAPPNGTSPKLGNVC